jgi:hypothetical protein
MPDTTVWETWQPQAGDYVRVERGPECRAHHAYVAGDLRPVYGRVESVDRSWDDPSLWVVAAIADGEDPDEMLRHAADARGHYYYVSDALDRGRYLLVDEQCCALELTKVDEAEARAAIEALRTRLDAMARTERFFLRLGATVGVPA